MPVLRQQTAEQATEYPVDAQPWRRLRVDRRLVPARSFVTAEWVRLLSRTGRSCGHCMGVSSRVAGANPLGRRSGKSTVPILRACPSCAESARRRNVLETLRRLAEPIAPVSMIGWNVTGSGRSRRSKHLPPANRRGRSMEPVAGNRVHSYPAGSVPADNGIPKADRFRLDREA